ncbi:uncharacterized protein LOC143922149 [Arctopsyche grandis]|uniref:uncharacterized protein LOC143922149 n=1 Tax=Arctopsyche grandis TaxID=121162 RepID=UPI00406D6B78
MGASGDLAKRKIMPSLSKVVEKDTEVYAYARSSMDTTYAIKLREFYDYTDDFPERVKYFKGEYNDLSSLKDIIDKDTFMDHYLLKPLMICLYGMKNKLSKIFDKMSNQNIKSVECFFIESILAEGRAYFDQNGIIKDVMQNHLIEVVASLLYDETYIFGQYKTYCEEMNRKSETETFAAFKCTVNNKTWKNTPFIMVAGKGLSRKATEIIFNIKTDNEEIQLAVKENANAGGDYEEIFSSLITNSFLPAISFKEAKELWRLFDKTLVCNKTPLIYYPIGTEMLEEAKNIIKKD